MFGIKPLIGTEAAGWYGMIALIVAYGPVSFSVISGDGIVYQLLNLTGAIGLIIVAASKHVIQSVLLNIFWAAIGILALIHIIF